MRCCFLVPTALLSAALALGCADQPSPTAPAADRPLAIAPAFSVERGPVGLGFAFDDGVHILFLGLSPEDVFDAVCTENPLDLEEVNQLLVTRPDGSQKLQFKGEVTVVVMDLAIFIETFCEDPASVPTYIGTARLRLNDSDFDLSGPGADAAQMHLVGRVTDEDGEPYHLVAINQSIVPREFTSPEDFEFSHRNVQIKLTPR